MGKKVLIIGETFHKNSGGGITLCNLFKHWSPENLAVATTPKSILKSDFSVCSNYYRLGEDEDDSCFLFKAFLSKNESGKVSQPPSSSSFNLHKINYNSFYPKTFALNVFNFFVNTLGLNFLCEKYKVSEKFVNWVEEFDPDFIYTQLSTLQLIQFTSDLLKVKNTKLIIHIMDDWPKTITDKCLFRKKYWDKTIESKFQTLLDSSDRLLTISDGMKEEYQKRYGKVSDVFHNPVDVELWLKEKKSSNLEVDQAFKILYTGRIGKANSKSIFLLIKAIEFIRSKGGLNVELYIYSSDAVYEKTELKDFIQIKKLIPHREMPELLQSVDLLFLPLDFDQRSIRFAKLSMPTKASEYMISGTPILLFAPMETYLYQHANKYNWAKVVGEFSLYSLTESIIYLINNEKVRRDYAKKAKDFALVNFDSKYVNQKFEEVFNS